MNRIKELREEQGKTTDDVARLLGISRPSVTRYELEQRKLHSLEWGELAKFFNVRVGYVMGLEDER